jgi:hypothetical protein
MRPPIKVWTHRFFLLHCSNNFALKNVGCWKQKQNSGYCPDQHTLARLEDTGLPKGQEIQDYNRRFDVLDNMPIFLNWRGVV